MRKVLFICPDNSACSQMPEGIFREICGSHFEVHSAGLRSGSVNSAAVKMLSEIGINISEALLSSTALTASEFKAGSSDLVSGVI